jgi:hypothetical protein
VQRRLREYFETAILSSVDLSKTIALLALLLIVALALGETLSPGASEALASAAVRPPR